MSSLAIPQLLGGGIVLGYRCNSRCRHCLYGCGPHREDGAPDPAQLDALLDELAARAQGARYHIGGGEPLLDPALLERAVRGMRERGLALDYVETNASWARDPERSERIVCRLREAGLRCLLVSLSPFHAEHVPLERTLSAIEAAQRILPGGAFVWIPQLLDDLAGEPRSCQLDLDAFLAARGDRYSRALASRYSLIPGGRAGRFLFRHGLRRPAADLAGSIDCRARLADSAHFHVDGQGRYVPGLCAGLTIPLELLPGTVDLEPFPALAALVRGGLPALVELAGGLGFTPRERYSSPCDLCAHARAHLFQKGGFAELGPPGFYDRRSVDWGATGA